MLSPTRSIRSTSGGKEPRPLESLADARAFRDPLRRGAGRFLHGQVAEKSFPDPDALQHGDPGRVHECEVVDEPGEEELLAKGADDPDPEPQRVCGAAQALRRVPTASTAHGAPAAGARYHHSWRNRDTAMRTRAWVGSSSPIVSMNPASRGTR